MNRLVAAASLLACVLSSHCLDAQSSTPGTLWTLVHGAKFSQGHVMGDLDGDGANELVAVSGATSSGGAFYLYAFDQDRSVRAGFPVLIHSNVIGFAGNHPALADLNGDGRQEIILNEIQLPFGANPRPCRLHVIQENGRVMPGWPVEFRSQSSLIDEVLLALEPVVADLDGDGLPEILVTLDLYGPGSNGYRGHAVHAFRSDGSVMPGWPITLPNLSRSMVVVGNVDAIAGPEVLTSDLGGRITVLAANGLVKNSFTAPGGTSQYSYLPALSLLDADGDGILEIVHNNSNVGRMLSLLRGDGSTWTGWPQVSGGEVFTGWTALGDLDGDGAPEIVARTDMDSESAVAVHAFRLDGSHLAGFPMRVRLLSNQGMKLQLIDVDGDRLPEVVHAYYEPALMRTRLFAYGAGATLKPGFPIEYQASCASGGTFSAHDFDNDGRTDITMGLGCSSQKSGAVFMDAVPARFSAQACPWPQFAGNRSNNAVLGLR